MKKHYLIIKADKIIGHCKSVEIDLGFILSQASEGVEYREVSPAELDKIDEFELVDNVPVVSPDKKDMKQDLQRKLEYPDMLEMVLALILKDSAKIAEYAAAIEASKVKYPKSKE